MPENDLDIYENEIEEIARQSVMVHSFDYKTLDEARKVINTEHYYYCFDALSLCYYEHNLTTQAAIHLSRAVRDIYKPSNEEAKERLERASLFYYIKEDSHWLHDYKIEKRTRPDFCLEGNRTVGVEVVELTTSYFKILGRIADENFGQSKSANLIKENAFRKHGKKAERYYYYEIDGVRSIGTNTIDINTLKRQFANQLHEKFLKYKSLLSEFDELIILGDAQRGSSMGVDSIEDVDDIYNTLKKMEKEINRVTVAIIWYDSNSGLCLREY